MKLRGFVFPCTAGHYRPPALMLHVDAYFAWRCKHMHAHTLACESVFGTCSTKLPQQRRHVQNMKQTTQIKLAHVEGVCVPPAIRHVSTTKTTCTNLHPPKKKNMQVPGTFGIQLLCTARRLRHVRIKHRKMQPPPGQQGRPPLSLTGRPIIRGFRIPDVFLQHTSHRI
jgi:hypothetical protein